MDKESIKKIINDFVDSLDEIRDFSISNDIEEVDRSTLNNEWKEYRRTGLVNIYITGYKE